MNKYSKFAAIGVVTLLFVVGVAYAMWPKNDESQLNQKQAQAQTEGESLPDQPRISTSLIQSADQLTETIKSYNLKGDQDVPDVDFASQTLVAFIYQSPNPGFLIEAAVEGSSASVTVTTPGEGCVNAQVVTPIVAYVVVPLTNDTPSVTSQSKQSTAECDF